MTRWWLFCSLHPRRLPFHTTEPQDLLFLLTPPTSPHPRRPAAHQRVLNDSLVALLLSPPAEPAFPHQRATRLVGSFLLNPPTSPHPRRPATHQRVLNDSLVAFLLHLRRPLTSHVSLVF